MSNKYYIIRIGNIFSWKVYEKDMDIPDNVWMILNIDYHNNLAYSSQSDGLISVEVVNSEPSWSEFNFATILNGSYTHQFGYGKNFKLGWNITDKDNNSQTCIISGGDLTNSWCRDSIARGIVNFLNILFQYENLNDYIASEEYQNDSIWTAKDTCEKILQLAEIITLYKKYRQLNSALGIVRKMETLIEKRLTSLVQEKK